MISSEDLQEIRGELASVQVTCSYFLKRVAVLNRLLIKAENGLKEEETNHKTQEIPS